MIEPSSNNVAPHLDSNIEINPRLTVSVAGGNRLLETSRDFSSLMIAQMLNAMRTTIHNQENPLHGGLSQEIFEDLLYQEYAIMLAHSGNLGIDKLIYQQLL